jgi:protein-disulfide isomerase
MPRALPSSAEAARILAAKRTRPPRRGPPAAGRALSGLVKALDARFGQGPDGLKARWREIVGEVLAARTEPAKLSKPRNGAGATLELKVDGPAAALVQHQGADILARVNLFLGEGAVAKLRIVQGPVRRADPALIAAKAAQTRRRRNQPLDAGLEAELETGLKSLDEGPLKAPCGAWAAKCCANRRVDDIQLKDPTCMDRRLFIGGASLVFTAAIAAPALADTTLTTIEADDMVMGSPHAPVTMIEYGSASCPHCAHFNNDVFPAIKARYVDSGKVRYVFREFLTPPLEFAAAGFLLARCAGRARYFNVLDAIFHAQAEIYATGDPHGHLLKIAQANGLDEKALDACLSDQNTLSALNTRVDRYVSRDGVNSTPTFLINGTRLGGEQTVESLSAAIDAALPAANHHHRRR